MKKCLIGIPMDNMHTKFKIRMSNGKGNNGGRQLYLLCKITCLPPLFPFPLDIRTWNLVRILSMWITIKHVFITLPSNQWLNNLVLKLCLLSKISQTCLPPLFPFLLDIQTWNSVCMLSMGIPIKPVFITLLANQRLNNLVSQLCLLSKISQTCLPPLFPFLLDIQTWNLVCMLSMGIPIKPVFITLLANQSLNNLVSQLCLLSKISQTCLPPLFPFPLDIRTWNLVCMLSMGIPIKHVLIFACKLMVE